MEIFPKKTKYFISSSSWLFTKSMSEKKEKTEKKNPFLSTKTKWNLDTGLDASKDVYFSMRNPNQIAKEKNRFEEEHIKGVVGRTNDIFALEGKSIGDAPVSKGQKKSLAKKERESKAEKWFGLPSQDNLSDEMKVNIFFILFERSVYDFFDHFRETFSFSGCVGAFSRINSSKKKAKNSPNTSTVFFLIFSQRQVHPLISPPFSWSCGWR